MGIARRLVRGSRLKAPGDDDEDEDDCPKAPRHDAEEEEEAWWLDVADVTNKVARVKSSGRVSYLGADVGGSAEK